MEACDWVGIFKYRGHKNELRSVKKAHSGIKRKRVLGSGYTAPELPGMGDPYQSQGSANSSRNAVDNAEILGYTPVKTTGNSNAGMQTTNVYVPKKGAAPNDDTAGSNNNTRNNSTSGNNELVPYQICDSEKELNYMMDMLFMNGAGSSSIPSVQMAYEWVSNPDNKGKEIPQDVLDTYYAYMGGINDDQIARSNQIAVGKDDEIGLVGKIYEAKAANEQSTDGSKPASPYYPQAKNTSPVSTSLPDFAKSADSTKQSSSDTVPLGKAGQTALGEIIKPNPDVFGTRSGYLYQAYQAGLDGLDFSRELRDDAAAGNFLDEIEKMYKAGETDAKIAEDSRSSETVPYVGADDDVYVPNMGEDDSLQNKTTKLSTVSNASGKNTTSTQWMKDWEYIKEMMIHCGAKNSKDLAVQEALKFFMDYENLSQYIPQRHLNAFENFLATIDDDKKMLIAMKFFNDKNYDYNYESLKQRNSSDRTLENDLSDGYQRFSIEQDFNYIMDMLFLNGAGSSSDPGGQIAYQYFMNPENRGKRIPEEMIKLYEDYIKTVYGFYGDRSHKIAAGAWLNDSYDERMETIKKRNSNTINPAEEVHVFPVEGGNFKLRDGELRDYPLYDNKNKDYHGGTDIKAPAGTPVYASFDGYVVEVVDKYAPGEGTSYGNYIKMKSIYNDDEVIVIYGHFNDIEDWIVDAFKTGAIIKAGTVIGYVGNTGRRDPPDYYHLHFEIRKPPYGFYNDTINPLEIVR